MAKDISILVGTIGAGLWVSHDGGRNYGRAGGIWGDMKVFGLKVDPTDPAVVYAGTDEGIFRSANRGRAFERLDSPMNDMHVWNIAVSPSDPSVIFAGTSPSALFRSADGGASWEQLPVDMAEDCPNVRVPRVTALEVDPGNPNVVWAGVEVDGVRPQYRRRRHLDAHQRRPERPGHPRHDRQRGREYHGLHQHPRRGLRQHRHRRELAGPGRARFLPPALLPGYHRQAGRPQHAVGSNRRFPLRRDRRNPALHRPGTRAWERMALPQEPNTPMWAFATHASDADFILCCSHYGQIYATADGGDWWVKLPREFSEVRGLAWTPN